MSTQCNTYGACRSYSLDIQFVYILNKNIENEISLTLVFARFTQPAFYKSSFNLAIDTQSIIIDISETASNRYFFTPLANGETRS